MSPRLRALLERESSTRPASLVRIAMALLLWTRFGMELAAFHFTAEQFPLIATAFWISTAAMFVGWRSQLSTAVAGLTVCGLVFWGGVHEDVSAYRHHHVYILAACTLWLSLTPCGGSYSIDRWLVLRRSRAEGRPVPVERAPDWGTWVVLMQLSACYFWSAWDKSTPAFLDGTRLVQIFLTKYGTSDIPFDGFELVCLLAAWATVLGEYALAVGVLVRWPLRVVVPAGLLLHAALFLLIPVSTFSATCMILYLLVLDADRVHRFLDAMQGIAPD